MIVDSHMHVGEFPLFNVAMDRDGLVKEMREHEISTGLVFHPDNALVHDIIGRTSGVYGLVWANPRNPDVVMTVTLRPPSSRASARVNPTMPALAAA